MASRPGAAISSRVVLQAVSAGLAVAVGVWSFSFTPWHSRLEGATLDARFRLRTPIPTAPRIVIIDIDSKSLAREKAWPWPRDRHTRLLELTTKLGVSAIGFDIFFAEAAPPASLTRDDFFARGGQLSADDFPDYDADFARGIALAKNVYLAQLFAFHEKTALADDAAKLERADTRLRELWRRGEARREPEEVAGIFPTVAYPDAVPLPRFSGAARGVGTVQVREDPDGVVRHFPVLVRYDLVLDGEEREPCLFPSLPLVLACHALDVQLSELVIGPGRRLTFPPKGDRTEPIHIPLNDDGMVLVNWAGDYADTFHHVSYALLTAVEEQLEWAAIKAAMAAAGPGLWDRGPQGLVDILVEFTQDEAELRAMLQLLFGAHVYQELLEANPATTAADGVRQLLGPQADNPEAFNQQAAVFWSVAAHQAAIGGHPRPEGVSDELWEQARVLAGVLAQAGGASPADAPYYFRGEPVRMGDEVVFAARHSPLLHDAVCFYGLTAAGTHDMRPTPVNSVYPMLGVHPNLFNSIVTNQLLSEMPRAWRLPLYAAFGLFVALYAANRGAARVAAMTVLVVLGYVLCSYLLFVHGRWAVDVVGPSATVLGAATLVAYQSYRREERQRKHIRGAFEQYMNPNIVKQIADDPDRLQLGGQELDATAFFSDVAGFTTISESLSSQDLVALLNEYLTAMTEIVFQYDGLLDKYEGDAIIAIFGAPVQTDDHATRACHASIDMQRKLIAMREQWREQGRHELTARIGLSSGLMTVGNMGSTMRFDYTMMGDTVNLAARLEGANKEYATHLMCSEATIKRCNGSVQARELDLLRVKGKTEPVRVFEMYAKKGDQLDPAFAEVVQHYDEGLRLYRDWQFAEAVAAFERALAAQPDDGPSKTYLQRCKICIEHPPPPDWDGVFTMTTK